MKLFKGGFEAPLFFHSPEGEALATFVFDLAGNLVVRGPDGNQDAFLPYGIGLVEYTFSPQNPIAWEITVDDIRQKITDVIESMPYTSELIRKLYPNGGLATYPEFFVAPQVCNFEHAEVIRAIELHASAEPSIQDTLTAALADHGIHPIPPISQYHEKYHKIADGEIAAGSVIPLKNGWMSNTRIYQKTTVAAA